VSRPSYRVPTPPDTDAAAPATPKTLSPAAAARLFKLLGDETRLRVVLALARRGEMNVGELCEAIGIHHPAMSRHLAWLLMARIIACRPRGRYHYYALTGGLVRDLLRFVWPGAGGVGTAEGDGRTW
jgi:DNA-binding transcriptional ArsR family regulator